MGRSTCPSGRWNATVAASRPGASSRMRLIMADSVRGPAAPSRVREAIDMQGQRMTRHEPAPAANAQVSASSGLFVHRHKMSALPL
jgi:hypothetical protein